jgi:hypothetical protein
MRFVTSLNKTHHSASAWAKHTRAEFTTSALLGMYTLLGMYNM